MVRAKIESCGVGRWKINVDNKAPKNRLPMSPINNAAGCQLKRRNANMEPQIGISTGKDIKEIESNITNIDPASNPSIPSIKLIKLITDVENNKEIIIVIR
ncbi:MULTISPECIES: hypothetical protein [unclassified Prochlorococcus]|uniref:hypothetical protein n=1 Tax=Prochlorococcus sp. MIT 0602 TaxID=1499499 RepID=UPI001F4CFE49|nr:MULTISPECIES: hypothetical protein [unclassified Prochlorococcus]